MIAEIPPAGPLTAAAKIFGYLIIEETKFSFLNSDIVKYRM